METKRIPDGFHTVTPYLIVEDAGKLVEFLEEAFDAKLIRRTTLPDGPVTHATVKIGSSMVMMGQAMEDNDPTRAMLYLYVADMDKLYHQAIEAGGISVQKPRNEFYGDRLGGINDPFGNTWWIASHVEDVSQEELERRFREKHGE